MPAVGRLDGELRQTERLGGLVVDPGEDRGVDEAVRAVSDRALHPARMEGTVLVEPVEVPQRERAERHPLGLVEHGPVLLLLEVVEGVVQGRPVVAADRAGDAGVRDERRGDERDRMRAAGGHRPRQAERLAETAAEGGDHRVHGGREVVGRPLRVGRRAELRREHPRVVPATLTGPHEGELRPRPARELRSCGREQRDRRRQCGGGPTEVTSAVEHAALGEQREPVEGTEHPGRACRGEGRRQRRELLGGGRRRPARVELHERRRAQEVEADARDHVVERTITPGFASSARIDATLVETAAPATAAPDAAAPSDAVEEPRGPRDALDRIRPGGRGHGLHHRLGADPSGEEEGLGIARIEHDHAEQRLRAAPVAGVQGSDRVDEIEEGPVQIEEQIGVVTEPDEVSGPERRPHRALRERTAARRIVGQGRRAEGGVDRVVGSGLEALIGVVAHPDRLRPHHRTSSGSGVPARRSVSLTRRYRSWAETGR